MKRLLDDPEDEVTRLLLRAAVNHEPPRSGKLRLIAALGAGSALGLSASDVLAWLGGGSGKVALAVTIVGVSAGSVYLSARPSAEARIASAAVVSNASAEAAARVVDAEPAAIDPEPIALDPEPGASSRRVVEASKPEVSSSLDKHRRKRALPNETGRREVAEVKRGLSDETEWVDALRRAAERPDENSFERLLRGYEKAFPDGQLQPEVTRLRNSLSTR